jgi:hypothetical protein
LAALQFFGLNRKALKHDRRCNWMIVVAGASDLRACAFGEFWDFTELSECDQ